MVLKKRQNEMHTPETLLPEASSFEVKSAIGKLHKYINQVLIKFQQN